ncbi:MAG: phosphate/phosphite/phosphonate ABC transporter substrate-binding protein, partial [Thermoflexales bacterium]
MVLVLTGCAAPAPAIILSDLRPLPETNRLAVPLRVAVAAVISPKGTAQGYQPLLNYLGRKINRPIELVQRRTYAEVNDLIAQGQVDMAFVCTSAYVEGHDWFGMELLAAPQVNGESVYHSVLIVPADSSVHTMSDLRGKVFAFTDPMSLSGRVYPTALVQALGSTPEKFFARTFFTYSHDDAIRAVADRVADGAMVDSLVYDFALARDPALGRLTRQVVKSPAFGIPPVVVGPQVRPQLRAELQEILLGLADDPSAQAREALQSIGADRFVTIGDEAYRS